MYVKAKVRGFNTRALIDTGASHNFIEVKEAKQLGLQLKKEQGGIKVVNTEARPICGVARDVRLHIGDWCGQVDFTVVPMDDYPIVLGMEFLDGVRAYPYPSPRPCASWAKKAHEDHSIGLETKAKIPVAILTKSRGASKLAKGWHVDKAKAANRVKEWTGKNWQSGVSQFQAKGFKGDSVGTEQLMS
ncbi:hypothetical protein Acr_29g0000970 [Actinidia rufa]|uniref:Uncharacterized protein n=1 Tax=Actinidia rufa TaxID=165716 RepID=A0A7J0HD83_9ERIC|nr:hypothetical protein Acr_29g0000970 [Actinidia rufa]